MYVNLRRYPKIGAGKEAIGRSVEDELLPELRRQEGFRGYCAFWDEEGAGVSVSLFGDAEAAHRSTDAARRWVMHHQDFLPGRGEEFSGACVAHEVSHGREREAGEGRKSLHVLVRELGNVPGTQDTRAFVQQRTPPMITRWPGFRGVCRRDSTAAKCLFERLLRGLRYRPRRLVADGLKSCGAARRDILPDVPHRTSRHLTNRAENSHRPTRRRERQMRRLESPEQAQRFLSAHAMPYGHFRPRLHLMTAARHRRARARAVRVRRQETCVQMAA